MPFFLQDLVQFSKVAFGVRDDFRLDARGCAVHGELGRLHVLGAALEDDEFSGEEESLVGGTEEGSALREAGGVVPLQHPARRVRASPGRRCARDVRMAG
ncbi:MAG: hypothetical protein DYG94_05340 [Leptolyngbya sp. PLA3]|nr:MAG: hypothetical protein EDM82_04780 [Cyanobacteria bacterium CYA]MCE7968158.1 hypothetical protein [Leptolyngbya sp. PL-A3]